MQLERHECPITRTAAFVRRPAHQNERGLKLGPATCLTSVGLRGKALGGLLNRNRRTPRQPLPVGEPDFKLNPDRQRVHPERIVIQGVWKLRVDCRRKRLAKFAALSAGRLRAQGSRRSPRRRNGCPEQARRDRGDRGRAIGLASLTCHRRGSADADWLVIRTKPVAHTAHEHRHVGPLPPSVSMKLVEHEEVEALRSWR